jgi:DNA-binding protein HU-beta
MNKSDLVEAMATDAGISKAAAAKALDSLMSNVKKTLKDGGKLALVGFGSFTVKERAARDGRNPQSGALIKIPARRVVSFKPGSELKSAVN